MNLTTLDRVKKKLDIDGTEDDDALSMVISGVSGAIERFLNRKIERKARTEIYRLNDGQTIIQLQAYPIASSPAPQFRNDWAQGFTDPAIDAANYFVDVAEGPDSTGQVRFTGRYELVPGEGVFQAIYTGGMGSTAVRMIGVVASISGLFTDDETVVGGTSGARGILKTVGLNDPQTAIAVDVLSGKFVAGETLTGVTSTKTCTLSSITTSPLIFDFPEIVTAADIQVVHEWKRKDSMGTVSLSAEGGSVQLETPTYELLPGVQKAIGRHRNLP